MVCTWCAGIVIPRKKETEGDGDGEKKRFRYVTSSRKKPKKSEDG